MICGMNRFLPLIIVYLCVLPAHAGLRVVVLDVGEGQSVLLRQDGHGVLIDTGHAGRAAQVLRSLRRYGVEQLDYLILTHLHPDHASGYFRLREAFPGTPVLDHHQPLPEGVPNMMRWTEEALARDPLRRRVMSGDAIVWRDVMLEFLWPRRFEGANINHHSLVIRVCYGDACVLIMGDAGHAAEAALLEKYEFDSVDLLVAGHHGAGDASSGDFIAAVEPRLSVVSIDRNNIYGYPSLKVLDRLSRHSDELRLTYRHGDICREWDSPDAAMKTCSP